MKIKITRNLHFLLLLLFSLTNSIIIFSTKPLSDYINILLFIFSILASVVIRYSYELSVFYNKWHSIFNRKNYDPKYEEPSLLSIGAKKLFGYLILATQIYILLAI